MSAREWQFDGLVGPTHNYAGLALGNLAAASNAGAVSNPRAAALQGLEKMRFVRDLGIPQAVLPPHYRPLVFELERLGFRGNLTTIMEQAFATAPGMLAALYSSSFMWAANAATITPSVDSAEKKLQVTPANLVSHFHRSVESHFGQKLMQNIFHNHNLFSIHNDLQHVTSMGDEGAANHMRVCDNHSKVAFNIFVYGNSHERTITPTKFPARQSLLASQAIARSHGLDGGKVFYFMQNPDVIDQGVFHNDVIAMNTTSLMVVHEEAFIPEHQQAMRDLFAKHPHWRLREIRSQELSVADAVKTYLFNSELLELPGGIFTLVAPSECENHAGVRRVVDTLIHDGLLGAAHYLDVRESMRNGGGPACLRLRIVLDAEQETAMHQGVVLTDEKYTQLRGWVQRHYRDRLTLDDLRDPEFVRELDAAYGALEPILGMPGLYNEWRIGSRY